MREPRRDSPMAALLLTQAAALLGSSWDGSLPEGYEVAERRLSSNGRRGSSSISSRHKGSSNWRPTAHPACLAIGIPRLQRVPIYVQKLVHGAWNASWRRGHYPYATCPVSGPSGLAASMTVATLLVADHQYAEVIPRWAAGSRAANVDLCVVGQVGASDLPCQAARHVGCECMRHEHASAAIGRKDSSFARAGARGRSVRYRFEYAQALLARNYSVLMLDADVFLREAGMARLLGFLRTGVVGYDFALMNNHPRPEAYDDLNWGVAWMSPSETSKHLLSCLLGAWDHHAFSDPRTGSYGLRSQPRVNHLIESSLMRGGGASRAPRVCMLPDELTERALMHMTGYPTVEHKITCARTMGLHQVTGSAWTRSPQRQLWYRVPEDASPQQQRDALIAAARLASELNRTLVLPGALFRGRPVAFCALFDFVGMRLGSFFTQAEAATAGALFGAGECIVPAVAPLENKTYSGVARAMSAWDSKPYVCVPFETLAQLAFKLHLPEWAFVCNPTSEAVRSTHSCSSKRNKTVSLYHGRKKGGKLGRKAPRKKNTHGQTSRTTHRGRHFRREEHPKGEREEESSSHGLMGLIRRAFVSG